jgi:hypothetical protein
LAESRRRAGEAYQTTERGRERHRTRSLAYYHRRGKEQRRQRRATAALSAAPADTVGQIDGAAGEPGHDADRTCLTHSRNCESGPAWATVEATQTASALEVGAGRCVAEIDDAQKSVCCGPLATREGELWLPAIRGVAAPPAPNNQLPGPVVTTVAQVRAALAHADEANAVGVDVWGRCARCGRVGRVVHFDGVLRARAQASW